MPEMSTITVPTAIRRHPARAHGIPPLRTLSSSPDSGGRRADWLVIRRYGALRRRQNALWKPPAGPSRVQEGSKRHLAPPEPYLRRGVPPASSGFVDWPLASDSVTER